jgi:arsenate reductase (thioredoxin)
MQYKDGKKRVLFVCVHNSARSQMAEAFLNSLAGDRFSAESAGLEPGKLNHYAAEVMREEGIDIAEKKTNDVFDFFKEGRAYDYVVTVCDGASGERCPVFPGKTSRLHWSFEDPSTFTGTGEDIRLKIRKVRDAIKNRIEMFIKETR